MDASLDQPVYVYRVLYTRDVCKKQKTWHDGVLRVHSFNKRALLYDLISKAVVDDAFIHGKSVLEMQELMLERTLVDVCELLRVDMQNVKPVLRQPRGNLGLSPIRASKLNQLAGNQERKKDERHDLPFKTPRFTSSPPTRPDTCSNPHLQLVHAIEDVNATQYPLSGSAQISQTHSPSKPWATAIDISDEEFSDLETLNTEEYNNSFEALSDATKHGPSSTIRSSQSWNFFIK